MSSQNLSALNYLNDILNSDIDQESKAQLINHEMKSIIDSETWNNMVSDYYQLLLNMIFDDMKFDTIIPTLNKKDFYAIPIHTELCGMYDEALQSDYDAENCDDEDDEFNTNYSFEDYEFDNGWDIAKSVVENISDDQAIIGLTELLLLINSIHQVNPMPILINFLKINVKSN